MYLKIVTTTRTSECLVFRKEDYESLTSNIPESSDLQEKLARFLRVSPLFASLSFEKSALTRYCEIIKITPNKSILLEGELAENVFFIRHGECNVIKSIQYIQEKVQNGSITLHRLSPEHQYTQYKSKSLTYIDVKEVYGIKNTHESSTFQFVKKLVHLHTLTANSSFGIIGDFVSVKKKHDKTSVVSIISSNNVELIAVSMIDFQRFCTTMTCEVFYFLILPLF